MKEYISKGSIVLILLVFHTSLCRALPPSASQLIARINPNSYPATMNPVLLTAQEGDFSRALSQVNQLIEQSNGVSRLSQAMGAYSSQLFALKALILMADQQLEKAWPALNNAIALSPSKSDLHTLKALMFHLGSDQQRAVDSLREAIFFDRFNLFYVEEAWDLLAQDLAFNGDIEMARESLQKAIEIKPDYLDARVALARLEIQAGNRQAALQAIRPIVLGENVNDIARIVYASSLMMKNNGRIESASAKSAVEIVAPLFPDDTSQSPITSLASSDALQAITIAVQAHSIQGEFDLAQKRLEYGQKLLGNTPAMAQVVLQLELEQQATNKTALSTPTPIPN